MSSIDEWLHAVEKHWREYLNRNWKKSLVFRAMCPIGSHVTSFNERIHHVLLQNNIQLQREDTIVFFTAARVYVVLVLPYYSMISKISNQKKQ